jgi:hypothetical protein
MVGSEKVLLWHHAFKFAPSLKCQRELQFPRSGRNYSQKKLGMPRRKRLRCCCEHSWHSDLPLFQINRFCTIVTVRDAVCLLSLPVGTSWPTASVRPHFENPVVSPSRRCKVMNVFGMKGRVSLRLIHVVCLKRSVNGTRKQTKQKIQTN